MNAYKETDYTVAPTLFMEFAGSETSVERDVEVARSLADDEGCERFDFEADAAAREKLWEARHDAALAIQALYPGQGMMGTDVCVPISDLPGALQHARETIASRGLEGVILGHVGDGNYHAVFPVDTGDSADQKRAEEVNAEIVDYALERGGTCTGEHGIGLGKIGHLEKEHGDSLPFMRGIKRLADPNGIMNPGKIFGRRRGTVAGTLTEALRRDPTPVDCRIGGC